MLHFDEAMKFLEESGVSFEGNRPSDTILEKLDYIANATMTAYNRLPGDRELVGWFVFGGAADADGQITADGICYIPADPADRRAAIGISQEVLEMDLPEFAVVGVALHELAHLTAEAHDDLFVERLMELQYNYYKLKEGLSR